MWVVWLAWGFILGAANPRGHRLSATASGDHCTSPVKAVPFQEVCCGDDMTAPKDVHILTPKTCEHGMYRTEECWTRG